MSISLLAEFFYFYFNRARLTDSLPAYQEGRWKFSSQPEKT